jgi:hypothetical protein
MLLIPLAASCFLCSFPSASLRWRKLAAVAFAASAMRKYVVYAILVVSALALVVRAVGSHLQPAVPVKTTGDLISFFLVLGVVAPLVANIKDISRWRPPLPVVHFDPLRPLVLVSRH